MANERQNERQTERLKEQQRIEAEMSEEEQKRINIHLRGGKDVTEQEDERGVLGASPEQSGQYRNEMARDYGTKRELKSDEADPEGRRGGRSDH